MFRGGFCCNIGKNNTDNVTIICNDYISDKQYIVTTLVSIGYVAPRSPRSSWLLIKIRISNENGSYPFYVDVLSVLYHRQDSYWTWLYIWVKCWCPIIHNPYRIPAFIPFFICWFCVPNVVSVSELYIRNCPFGFFERLFGTITCLFLGCSHNIKPIVPIVSKRGTIIIMHVN